ncbi:MAG: dolichol kinase [Nitrososphaeria archaeon]
MLGITASELVHDLPWSIVLLLWVVFVVMYVARWFYGLAIRKGYPERSATYFGRKVIHILAGGLVAILLPFLFEEPILPLVMAAILTIAVYLPHRTGKLYYWFQDPTNMYEVHFTIAWGLLVFFLWFLDRRYWLAVVPVLFMAWGDGVTGIVRNFRYKQRVKAWEGSLAMLITCVPIGAIAGWGGIIAGILSTLAEKQKYIDDNIAVPLVAVIVLLIFRFTYPAFLQSLY